jgi:Xaa-Pro aminopeptidase
LTVFSQRRKKLLAKAKGKQVAIFAPQNLFYVTDFYGGGGAIVRPDKTIVVTSPLEAGRVREVGKELDVVVVKKWKEVPAEVERQLDGGKTVIDAPAALAKPKKFKVRPEMFVDARRTKDELEIERIRTACAKTDKTYQALERAMKPGKTEWELAGEVMRVALEEGLTPSNSESSLGPVIIASGPHGAYGHSELSGRRLKEGDFVVADLFFRYQGYNSDETRTFAVGRATSEMKKHYEIVKEAQQAALDAAKDGVACGDVNEAAVSVLRKNGVAKYLNHSIGHGVGIDIHEMPGIFKGNKVKLARNDVITDEPGIYFVGKYGVRIEDTLLVDRKAVVFTKFTKDLVTCG